MKLEEMLVQATQKTFIKIPRRLADIYGTKLTGILKFLYYVYEG